MRVLVLVPSLLGTSPGQRFRIEQWARYLEKEGFRFTFSPFEDSTLHQILYLPGQYATKVRSILSAFAHRLALVRTVRNYDLIFVYREAAVVGPALIERLIARQGVPMIYDFDDPIWLPYSSPTHGALAWLKWPAKVAVNCSLAKRVIVGNRLLAGWARQHSKQVNVIPSTIDLERYPLKPSNGNNVDVTLGWTGSHSTLPFLSVIQETLKRLAKKHPFRFVVISHTNSLNLDFGQTEMIAKRWAGSTEAIDLHDMDIGLAPFPNEGWTPWRCHGKVLQYMAAGIPTVASPVGIVPDYIIDGKNGLLASTEDEWIDKVSQLIEEPSLRYEIGSAGRKTVEAFYSAQVWLPKIREVFESVKSSL